MYVNAVIPRRKCRIDIVDLRDGSTIKYEEDHHFETLNKDIKAKSKLGAKINLLSLIRYA